MGRYSDKTERIQAMFNSLCILKNEQGSAIVIAMLTLMVVTIIGVSSSNKTASELQVVRNDGIYKHNFYLAEGAAQEGIQRLWNLIEDPETLHAKGPAFLTEPDEEFPMDNLDNWDNDGEGDDTAEISPLNPDARVAAVDDGIVDGGSLEMTATNVHEFRIFGLSEASNGRVFIQIGYRQRF